MTNTLPATANKPPTGVPVRAAVIGGGPAGLMAADALLKRGVEVHVYDAMPSLGRKVLMAGKSGLNITHAEDFAAFMARYGGAEEKLRPMLDAFGPGDVRAWADGLGVATFEGSSGRVFPKDMKAAPLLRTWLRRLRAGGVTIHTRHRWAGWAPDGGLRFGTPDGDIVVQADITVLALGGASWPKLGSDAAWVPWLKDKGVAVASFRPSNCGFDADFSDFFLNKFEGEALKHVALTFDRRTVWGDVTVTRTGLESGPVYALSSVLVKALAAGGAATLEVDLMPDQSVDVLAAKLSKPQGKKSFATHLKRTVGLNGAKAGLLREGVEADALSFDEPRRLAAAMKAVPIRLTRPRPVEEAISSAGGVRWDAVDDTLQLNALPGVYVAGEMLDWDAPTGGYLLTACLSMGAWIGAKAAL